MRGAVNPFSVLLIAALLAGLYYVIMFGPNYIDNMSVSEAADVGIHAPGDDAHVMTVVLNRANMGPDSIGTHYEDDPETGEKIEKKGLGLTEDNVTIVRDEAAKTMTITIDYSREVLMKPSHTWRQQNFHVEKTGSYAR